MRYIQRAKRAATWKDLGIKKKVEDIFFQNMHAFKAANAESM